jgi:CBS domain containing-hemolysin-like protein
MDFIAFAAAMGLVLLNGFFVATEFALVKVRPTRIEELLRKRARGAQSARIVIGHIDGYLSATQLGVTLASLGLGWIGEPAFARLFLLPLSALGLSDPAWLHRIALVTAFAVISLLHIVVGELVPKSIAIRRAEMVALAVALPMRAIYALLYPAIWALGGISNGILRAMGMGGGGLTEHHSEEEIKMILNQARSAGLLSASRSELLGKVLVLPTKTAGHLMVPRNDVVFLDTNLSAEENVARAMASGHTRFPLCQRELDEVLGVLDIRDVLFEMRSGPVDLQALAKPVPYFPELMGSERLLTEFRTRHATMAIVVDEYGGAAGIVTPADVVAAVMGDLDEDDEADVVALPGGAYDVDGIAPLEEIGETLKITFDTPNVRTVAGFLMERLGRMPRLGDRVGLGKYNFYIMDIEGPRVRRVRIQVEPSRELPPNLRAVHARPPEGATPVPPEGAKAAPDAEPKLPDAPPKL